VRCSDCSVAQCIAVIAVWRSALQCGAVRCSVVQCGAVWCNVVQSAALKPERVLVYMCVYV